jgi:hypothetical protein
MREDQKQPRQLDYLTKYATAAIRFNARVGGREAWQEKHRNELMDIAAFKKSDEDAVSYIQGGRIPDPTFAAFSWSEGETIDDKALREWMDLVAVEKMYGSIALLDNSRIRRRCIEIVYEQEPDEPLFKSKLTDRAYNASAELHYNVSGVWVYLKDARLIFARARGLRLEEWHYEYLKRLRGRCMKKNIVQGSESCDIMPISTSAPTEDAGQ